MYAVPVPPVRVAVALFKKEYVLEPARTLHGVLAVQLAPIVSTVLLVWDTTSVLGVVAAPPLPCRLHAFVAVHTYRLLPGTAVVRRYTSPVPQLVGNADPLLAGLVETAPEKSTAFDWFLRSIRVCPIAAHTQMANTPTLILTTFLFDIFRSPLAFVPFR
jgi:hypothetical protein